MAMSLLRSMVRMATRAAGTLSSLPRPQQGSLCSASAAAGRGARRLHVSRDGPHAYGAFAAMTVAASSAFAAGVWYWMEKSEDPAMKTDAYLRRAQFAKALGRARASYDKQQEAMVEEEEEEEEEDDPAMKARFADWMEKYGRKYRDEEEKNRRFRIFKACARFVDEANAEAAESGSSVWYCLNHFADWSAQELAVLCGER